MNKQEELKKLEEEISRDESLPLREANLVFGEGDVDCKVMFIGEAPGFHEDQQRRPFVGRAGQLLNRLIGDLGWQRGQVYITNIIKRRPPENRDPLPDEIEAYRPYLARQIEIINPKVIATLGRFSMNYFLPTAKISRDQGQVFKWEETPTQRSGQAGEKGFRFVVPLFHPAAALRSTNVLETLEASFKKLPAILEKCESYNPAEPTVVLSGQAPGPKTNEPTISQESLF